MAKGKGKKKEEKPQFSPVLSGTSAYPTRDETKELVSWIVNTTGFRFVLMGAWLILSVVLGYGVNQRF